MKSIDSIGGYGYVARLRMQCQGMSRGGVVVCVVWPRCSSKTLIESVANAMRCCQQWGIADEAA